MKNRINYPLLLISALFLVVIFNDFGPVKTNPKKFHKLSKSERLMEAYELEMLKTRDPKTGRLPDNFRAKEIAFAKSLPSTNSAFYKKSMPDIQTCSWIQRGPSNISGRMLAITFDDRDDNIINAGAASGGAWQTTNGGYDWQRTSSVDATNAVRCIVQDRRANYKDIWYYGTGELLSTTERKFGTKIRTLLTGNGIYKSTDNGKSWNQLISTKGGNPGRLSEIFQGVWNIVPDNKKLDEDDVYAACYGAIMKSTDGGDTWKKALGDLTNKSFGTDIIQTPGGKFYAALGTYTTTGIKPAQTGIWKSDNGSSWNDITPEGFPNARVIKLAFAPSNENVIYIFIEEPSANWNPVDISNFQSSNHYLWKYTYNPTLEKGTWEDFSQNLPVDNAHITTMLNSLGGYAMTLAVKPDDENKVIFGGTCLYLSTDGLKTTSQTYMIGGYFFNKYGLTWDQNGSYLHPDMHALAFSQKNTDYLIAGSDGGLHKTYNCIDTPISWQPMTNKLITSQFYSISMVPNKSGDDFLIGGLQDNSSALTTSNDKDVAWTPVMGGDGMSSAVANDGAFSIGTSQGGYLYADHYDQKSNSYLDIVLTPDTIFNSPIKFFTNFVIEPIYNDELYMPVLNTIWIKKSLQKAVFDLSYVYRNDNWYSLNHTKINDTSFISTLSISKVPTNRLYYGTSNGRVFRLDNCNNLSSAPFEITGPAFPQNAFVACIEVDKEDADNIIVVFSNYNVQSIFYSSDGGGSWAAQGGNLEANPDGSGDGPSIRFAKITHFNGKPIYFVGTSIGLFSTTQLTGSSTQWVQEGAELIGNMLIDHIDARDIDGAVAIATEGSGVWSTNLSTTGTPENNDLKFALNNFPNPAGAYNTIFFTLPETDEISISIYGSDGRKVKDVVQNKVYNEGIYTIPVSVSNMAEGMYYYRLQGRNRSSVSKFIVLR